ncbi:hypothetical protein NLJ89_g4232 [Agrocybe chaxingu]|uniref:Uncharacterized protein n=1 Tax=Agrocybe chaxingu TaxID=84603 RepID=A0A9W8MY44_9AGAR|nr:hypothetical protein NLJ89_g4232 [Agrocybe chaxingu]
MVAHVWMREERVYPFDVCMCTNDDNAAEEDAFDMVDRVRVRSLVLIIVGCTTGIVLTDLADEIEKRLSAPKLECGTSEDAGDPDEVFMLAGEDDM